MVEKKYIKFGVAALAVTALVIGLSVGITESQKNKNAVASNSVSASLAEYETYDYSCSSSGKSGKSGGGSGKSGKSGGYGHSMSYSGSGKSGKSGYRRALYVPGILEAFGDETKGQDMNQRRKLRNSLADDFDDRRLQSASTASAKSGKSSGSSKSGKSSSSECDHQYYYGSCHSGKSGKSGGYGSGSGKSGKSGGYGSGSGKSGKSGGYSSDPSGSGKSGKASTPSTCYDYSPDEYIPETPTTPAAISECVCEESPWKLMMDGTCVRDCGAVGEEEFMTKEDCCGASFLDFCEEFDSCPPIEPLEETTPSPTPFVPLDTYPPTSGGTTTVATEKTAMPTVEGEPRQ